jgi:hypothetical protein
MDRTVDFRMIRKGGFETPKQPRSRPFPTASRSPPKSAQTPNPQKTPRYELYPKLYHRHRRTDSPSDSSPRKEDDISLLETLDFVSRAARSSKPSETPRRHPSPGLSLDQIPTVGDSHMGSHNAVQPAAPPIEEEEIGQPSDEFDRLSAKAAVRRT